MSLLTVAAGMAAAFIMLLLINGFYIGFNTPLPASTNAAYVVYVMTTLAVLIAGLRD